MKRSRFPLIVLISVLVFFYLPILVMMGDSFNASKFGGSWSGFTTVWYSKLFNDRDIWNSLLVSLEVATGATLVACILGTTAALALRRGKLKLQVFHNGLIYTPLVVPEILMGISLLLFFTFCHIDCGLLTILLAHVTFCISYVTLTVLGRLQDFDDSLLEAARDLGANGWTTFWRVEFPLLLPGIISGGLLAFTLSIDDFVISFFVTGPGATPLPLRVYSMIKHSRNMPMINALSTILMAVTFACVTASHLIKYISAKKQNRNGHI